MAKEEEEEEEVQEDFQRDLKVVKEYVKSCNNCIWNASQGLAFIYSSCLVKKNYWKSYNLKKNLKTIGRVTYLDFYLKLVTGNRLPRPCNRLHKAFYEKMWLFTIEFEF